VSEEIVYSKDRWNLFYKFRAIAAELMKPLWDAHIHSIVYGSIARGDVNTGSDVDIFIPSPPPPTIIETTLEIAGVHLIRRQIIQATPGYAAKVYYYTDEKRGYSFPLVHLKPNEAEFYGFAGYLDYEQVKRGLRKPGVDKRLILIEPTVKGHLESFVHGREGMVAGILGVDVKIVLERVRILERREHVGRTGVYVKRELGPEEDVSEVYNALARSRAPMRRRIRKK
jgi:predicted nucleotidyltransferase